MEEDLDFNIEEVFRDSDDYLYKVRGDTIGIISVPRVQPKQGNNFYVRIVYPLFRTWYDKLPGDVENWRSSRYVSEHGILLGTMKH